MEWNYGGMWLFPIMLDLLKPTSIKMQEIVFWALSKQIPRGVPDPAAPNGFSHLHRVEKFVCSDASDMHAI
jgi:hypothetical protein